MSQPNFKFSRREQPDAIAPDGAEIRFLVDRPEGSTKLSICEALVKPGRRTACVSHLTIDEIWYVVRGTGIFHRQSPDGRKKQNERVTVGDALLIPIGYRFWVENTGPEDFVFLCCDSPPWPGADEAIVWTKHT